LFHTYSCKHDLQRTVSWANTWPSASSFTKKPFHTDVSANGPDLGISPHCHVAGMIARDEADDADEDDDDGTVEEREEANEKERLTELDGG
jgi:hypothetical protein